MSTLTTAELELANLALMLTGTSRTIADPTENTNERRAAEALYPKARDFVLSESDWEFATKWAALAASTVPASSPSNLWALIYDYPADAIKVRRVTSSTRRDERKAFQIANTGSALKILTNEVAASAEYTVAVTDPALFDPLFYKAVSYYLAAELVMPVKADPAVAKNAMEVYNQIIKAVADKSRAEGFPETDISLTGSTTYTHIAICNAALARIGHRVQIADLADNTDEARLASLFFGETVAQMLREFSWPFATRRVALVAAAPGSEITNWMYAYTLPTGISYVQGLVNPFGRLVRHDQRIPFEIGFDSTTGVAMLYTDLQNAEIIYSTTAVSVNDFDPLFRDALTWKLAAEFAPALGVDPRIEAQARTRHALAMSTAKTRAANEEFEGPDPDCDFLASRA